MHGEGAIVPPERAKNIAMHQNSAADDGNGSIHTMVAAMSPDHPSPVVGLLLAAGRGLRYRDAGGGNKLLARMPVTPASAASASTVVAAAAQPLLAECAAVIAAVRDDDTAVAGELIALGCRVVRCPCADEGMGSVLAWLVAQAPASSPLVIGLGDMPFIRPQTVRAVVRALCDDLSAAGTTNALVAPTWNGQRGHPVGFGPGWREALLALRGDQGARTLIAQAQCARIAVDDPGIVRDIDVPDDLGDYR